MTLKEGAPVKSITVGAGDVVSQSPNAGVSQKQGSTVTVVLSSGKPNVTVPSLSGMTCAAGRGRPCNRRTSNPSARRRAPTAIPCRRPSWCCGRSARHRTRRRRPTGPPSRSSRHWATRRSTVPNIPTSYSFTQAQAALTAVGLTATQNNESNATVPSGQVISTSPASGAPAPYGSAVTVNVSTGPPTTQVPNVIDDTVTPGHHRAGGGRAERLGCVGQPQQQRGRHPALDRLDREHRLVRPALHQLSSRRTARPHDRSTASHTAPGPPRPHLPPTSLPYGAPV